MTHGQTLVDEALDIGIHAGKEAMATLMRVVSTLPTPAQKIAALFIASGYLQHKIDGLDVLAAGEPEDMKRILRATFEVTRQALNADAADTLAGLVAHRAQVNKGQG